jgi:hypothetical protein
MGAFVLHGKHPPAHKLADKVRVKPIFRSLKAEGSGFSGQIADPELNLLQAVDELGALKLLGQIACGSLLCQLAGLRTEIVFLGYAQFSSNL